MNQEDLSIILIAQAAISLTALIVFFMMATNVGKIVRLLSKGHDRGLLRAYEKAKALGRNEQANEHLIDYVYPRWESYVKAAKTTEQRLARLTEMQAKYRDQFKAVGYDWPEGLN